MRTAVPLHEFMPYGAPDLLESRRRHLGLALTLASALALALYALSRGVASLIPPAPVAPVRTFEVDPREWVPIAPKVPVAPAPAPPSHKPAPVVHDHAPPLPVPDPLAPADQPPAPPPGPAGDATSSGPATPSVIGTAPSSDALPALGDWVYVEREPAALKEVKPEYPPFAMEAGIEGRVTVMVLVGKDGRVLDAVLSKTVHVPMLDGVALAAARQWVFTPGYANGHAVACWTAIPFRFRLH